MISIDDIIGAINLTIDKTKGQFILHRSMKEHPKFKVYKVFTYNLYKVVEGKKELIQSISMTRYAGAEDIMNMWTECDKSYITDLTAILSGDDYKKMRYV